MQQHYNGWKNLPTKQSKEILHELKRAKEHQKALLLISDTGLGKSNTIKMLTAHEVDGKHTYVVVVGDSFKVSDVVNALLEQLGGSWIVRTTPAQKLKMIAEKLREIKSHGGNPLIIIDEAENLKPAMLKRTKELYDAIIADCSIALIGTKQILEAIHNTKNKNRQSVPQLWRRFKAGVRYISELDKAKEFTQFFQQYIPDEQDLQDLLIELADNYGELHDYLDPVLRYASQQRVAVTEELFRKFHNLKPSKLRKAS